MSRDRMFEGHRIAVVVPCLDVSRQAVGVIHGIPAFIDHIIVVDDGSRDGLAEALGRVQDPRVVLLRHAGNRGLARAMETGFRCALELGADIVVKMDGDGQMDPAHLPRLLAPIASGQADLVKGNRFLRRRHASGMSPWRLVGNITLSFLTKLASGYWNVFDPTNGYVAVRRQVLEEIDLARLGPGYFFETSLLCEAYLVGAVARDVPIAARYNGEPSSLSIGRVLLTFPHLLGRAWIRRLIVVHFIRGLTPGALFMVAGAALAGFGLLFGGYHWVRNAGLGRPTPTGTIIVAVLPLIAGFQLLLQALVMDIGSVPSRSPWRRPRRRRGAPPVRIGSKAVSRASDRESGAGTA